MAIEKMKYETRNLATIAELAPNTKAAAEKLYAKAKELGADMLIYEGRRTIEEQRKLVAEGKSQTMRSYHLVGQAIDWVPVINGVDVWSNSAYRKAPYITLIRWAEANGWEWGGDWTDFVDSPHLQYNYRGYGTDKVLDAGSAPAPTPGLPAGIIGVVKVSVDGLNIRKGPGKTHATVGRAVKGRLYNVTANVNDWHEIIYVDEDGVARKGWVFGNNGQYLELVKH